MARDEHRRSALVRDIPRHLAPLGVDALRILDAFTMGLLLHERANGLIDLEALSRQRLQLDPHGDPAGTTIAAAIQAIGIGLLQQDQDRAELHELARRELDQPGNREAVVEHRRREALRSGASSDVQIGMPGDNVSLRPMSFDPAREFAADQHLTRLDGTSATLALADVACVRDENPEVDVEIDVDDEWGIDKHAGEGT